MSTPTRGGKPRDHYMLERHRVAATAAAALAAFGVALLVAMATDGGRDFAQAIDDRVRSAIQDARWSWLNGVARFFDIAGTWYITWPLRIAVAAVLARSRRWEQLWSWGVAIVLYEPMVYVLKVLYERPRPPLATGFDTYSFPSGHAVVGAAIAIGIVVSILPAGRRRRRYEYLAGSFAFFMAMSRVYLDAHWLSDVVAGTFIGAAVVIGTAAAVHEINDRLHVRGVVGGTSPPSTGPEEESPRRE